MTDVNFYQLGAKPLDAVLPKLLEKAVAAGFRAIVRTGNRNLLIHLDAVLWAYEATSFLPHALDGDTAALQPVLLTTGSDTPNNADIVVVIDGVLPDDLGKFKRTLYLFDGGDEAALALARGHWKELRSRDDVTPVYWRATTGGGWEKAA